MSLRAKEQVYKIRRAQYEIVKLRNALRDHYPNAAYYDDREDNIFDRNGNLSPSEVQNTKNNIWTKLLKIPNKNPPRPGTPPQWNQWGRSIHPSIEILHDGNHESEVSSMATLQEPEIKLKRVNKLSEKSRGRLFRHAYRFQESIAGTPVPSKTSMMIKPALSSSFSLNTGKRQEAEAESVKKVMWADVHGGSIATTSKPKKKESFKMSSLINKKDVSNWVKRFPEIPKELQKGREALRALNLIHLKDNDDYPPSIPVKKSTKVRSSWPPRRFNKEQPLPHERGLVGVEISEFDPACAFFFRSTKGVLNPHLLA